MAKANYTSLSTPVHNSQPGVAMTAAGYSSPAIKISRSAVTCPACGNLRNPDQMEKNIFGKSMHVCKVCVAGWVAMGPYAPRSDELQERLPLIQAAAHQALHRFKSSRNPRQTKHRYGHINRR